MNSVPYISTKYCQGGMGGRGSKNSKFVQMSYVDAPLYRAPNDRLPFSLSNMTDCVGACVNVHTWHHHGFTARLLALSDGWRPLLPMCARCIWVYSTREKEDGKHSFCNVQDGQVFFYSEMVKIPNSLVSHKSPCINFYSLTLCDAWWTSWVEYYLNDGHFRIWFLP